MKIRFNIDGDWSELHEPISCGSGWVVFVLYAGVLCALVGFAIGLFAGRG